MIFIKSFHLIPAQLLLYLLFCFRLKTKTSQEIWFAVIKRANLVFYFLKKQIIDLNCSSSTQLQNRMKLYCYKLEE